MKGRQNFNCPDFLIWACVADILLDLATLCLPLFVIRNLQISLKKKICLVGIFWLGAGYIPQLVSDKSFARITDLEVNSCVIASALRLAYILEFNSEVFTTARIYSRKCISERAPNELNVLD